jgi:crossover junction endodeoxyribonuclease RusA
MTAPRRRLTAAQRARHAVLVATARRAMTDPAAVGALTDPSRGLPAGAPVPGGADPECPSSRAWTFTVTAPAAWMNSNGRRDRRAETPTRRAWRTAAAQYLRAAKVPHLDRAHVVAELRFTDGRRRDPHNFYPTLKACVDGFVDAGLLRDDSSQYLIGPDVRMGQPLVRKPYGPAGEVVFTITELIEETPC